MYVFIVLVVIVVMLDFYRRLGKVEKQLRERLEYNRSSPVSSIQTQRESSQASEALSVSPVMEKQISPEKSSPVRLEDKKGLDFLGDNWMIKVGVLLVALSIGWFVTYAFSHDWIGPIGRVVLGILFGLGLLVFGAWRFSRSIIQGVSLLSIGVVSIYVSIFAGMTLYNFYSPGAGLFFMALVTAYMAVLSGVRKSRELIVITLITGLVAPLFVWSQVSISLLFLYLFILSVGVVVVDVLSGWRAATFFSLLGVFVYSLGAFISGDIDRTPLNFLMVLCFTVLFYGANMGFIIKTTKVLEYDFALTGLIGVAFFGWVGMTVDVDFVGLVFIVAALVFAVSSYALALFYRLYAPMLMYAAVALGFLFAATAKIFEGSSLVVLLAIEIGGLAIASFYILRENDYRVGRILIMLLAWPAVLSLENIVRLMQNNKFDVLTSNTAIASIKDLLVLAVLMGVFGVVASVSYRIFPRLKEGSVSPVSLTKWFFVGYTLLFIWFLLHTAIPQYYMASMVSLVLFTGVGLYLYVKGTLRARSSMRELGMVLFIIVLGRLFLVEFWTMNIVEKIITFFIVGALFLSTSFLLQRTPNNSDGENI